MPRLLPLIACCTMLTLPTLPLSAQRSVALVLLTGNATGHASAADDPDHPTITPDHPVTWGLSIEETHRSWRGALTVRHARADLGIRGTTSAVLTRAAIQSWGVAFEGGRRVAGSPETPTLHALLGAGLERNTFPVTGGDPRTVLATTLALEGAVPLSPRWHAVVRGEAVRTGGLFGADELPPGYAVRAGRRWALGVGVRWHP